MCGDHYSIFRQQFCDSGVVFFGYLINEIGFNLAVMRKNEEKLEKDLRTLHRMDKYYTIDKSLMNKTKGYLVNHETYID